MNITICIPLWNRGDDIKKLLSNLEILHHKLDKNVVNFNLIIADFCSTDVDLALETSKCTFPVRIKSIDDVFNIAVGITSAVNDAMTELVLITDADTVFDENIDLHRLCGRITEGQTFLAPICSTEAEPNGLWGSIYNSSKHIHVPTNDHGGSGFVLCYLSDWKRSRVFIDSGYLEERGRYWGGHDDVMSRDLGRCLSRVRYITDEIWTRPNIRVGAWYSTGGSGHYR
jgi:glycosyltransferase involved in cell wall biosynthesis